MIISASQTMSNYEVNSKRLYEINKANSLEDGVKESEIPSYEQYEDVKEMLENDPRIGSTKIFGKNMLNSNEMTNAYIKTMEEMSEQDFSEFLLITLGMQDTIEQQQLEIDNKDKFKNTNDYTLGYFQNMINTLVELDKNPNADNKNLIKIVDKFINNFQTELNNSQNKVQEQNYITLGEAKNYNG